MPGALAIWGGGPVGVLGLELVLGRTRAGTPGLVVDEEEEVGILEKAAACCCCCRRKPLADLV